MKKFILILVIATVSLSCKRTDETISTDVSIILLNQQGQNLLTSTLNLLKENDIEVFVVKNGETTLFKPLQGNPKGFFLSNTIANKDILILQTFEAFGRGTEYTTSLIKLGSYGTDTVKCQIVSIKNTIKVTKVWYNGVLKFDENVDKTTATFTVIK